MNDIAARLRDVEARIRDAAVACGRDPGSVRLVAVSKTKPASDIRAAYAAGQRDFGENYVKELVAKADELRDLPDVRFHFIGHLQRNKAKLVAERASVVHTIDSVKLAQELGKRVLECRGDGAELSVLVEVNVGGEAQKSGAAPAELPAVLDAIEAQSSLRLAGLMTVPPFAEQASDSRRFFDALAALRDAHGGASRLPELSMGMSHDLEHAIAAGATLVRVGTAIFGAR